MWHPLETSDWFSGDLCDTCCFSDSFAAAILHHHRRNIPSLLVLQPPRSRILFSYCLTACHQLGWFLFRRAEIISVLSPTANPSLRQLGQTQPLPWRHAGTPSHVRGNPLVSRWDFSLDPPTLDAATGTVRRSSQSPFSSSFSRQSVSMSSLQQLSNARANLLLFSSDFLRQSEFSSLLQRLLNARANLLLFSSDFPTPERIFFSSPAISYARANLLLFSSDFLTPERIFFSSVFILQKFLLSLLFLVVWMMPSPYSPSSFTLQSPDCSGIFLPDAFLSRFHGNHFSPGVIIRTFCRTFSLHRLFLLVLRRLVTSPSGRNHHSWAKRHLGGVCTISDLVIYLASFSLFGMTPPPARRIFFSPHGALAFELMSAWSRVVGVILVAG